MIEIGSVLAVFGVRGELRVRLDNPASDLWRAPLEVTARRLGNHVEIRFTVPTRDMDAQQPANIDRIEVWALTGTQVPAPLVMKHGTLVATVPVRRPRLELSPL